MELNRKELMGLFEKITGVTPEAGSKLNKGTLRMHLSRENPQVLAFMLKENHKIGEDIVNFYGVLGFCNEREGYLELRVDVRRFTRLCAGIPSHCESEHPEQIKKAQEAGTLAAVVRIESLIKNLHVHDLTNIMRGEPEDRARLYGMKETLRVIQKKLDIIKRALTL